MSAIHSARFRSLLVVTVLLFCGRVAIDARQELTREQQKEFLLKAKVVNSKQTKKGVTNPFLLTLSDGSTTHQGVFQSIDQHKSVMQFPSGQTEINFVDSYKYNVAAYLLAEMLGLDDIVPVYVERNWNGRVGSLSWVVPVLMDEQDRMKKKIPAPDPDAWNRQMYKIRVLDELVYDTDANLTNVLISHDWKIWRVDFTRAFRRFKDVQNAKNLVRCERRLLEKLKALDGAEFVQRTKRFLTPPEQQGVMARRDKIVDYFQKLIALQGEGAVLY
jgi:hypothetical protein